MLENLTKTPLDRLILSIADDEFILGYRNSEWTGIAPMLEEDVAFSSMAQDEIGHARLFYEMLAERTQVPADQIAYRREPHEFLSCSLMDERKLDWAHAIVRQFLYDTADYVRLEALSRCVYEPLANATQKIMREEKYHLMHGDMWMSRLARLSENSNRKLVAAINEVWPHALAIWEPLEGEDALIAEGILPSGFQTLRDRWINSVLEPHFRNLDLPFPPAFNPRTDMYEPSVTDLPSYSGRRGEHSESFRVLWEEMTEVYRIAPDAVW
jgi:ring-1,2-phenylacetyl-CoA epoxidase subunit PaaC